MTLKLSIFGLVVLTLINCQGGKETQSNKLPDSDSLKSPDLIEQSTIQIADLPPILNKIKEQIPEIDLKEHFDVDKESDDNLDEKYLKLDSAHIDYFYSTDELRQYHEYFSFHSYFYGYSPSHSGLTKVFIINTNYETAIYLDCFILNSAGTILDMFRPSYIEMQPTYGMIGYGSFNNDSIYKFIGIDYETVVELNDISIKDSSITTYELSRFGKINESTLKFETDTIYNDIE